MAMNSSHSEAVADWLFERMALSSDEVALIWHDTAWTYGTLLQRADEWQATLRAREVTNGSLVVVEGTFSPNACALLLAIARLRAVAVPFSAQTQRDALLDIVHPQLHILLGERDEWSTTSCQPIAPHALVVKLLERRAPGLVIFSSGSTGTPKAILHDFAALLEKFHKPRQKKRTLAFLQFDHIGGIDTLFNTFSSGGTLVTPASRDPNVVCRSIAAYQVHTLPTSPTFLNLLLLSEAWQHHDLSSLKVIAYGTEPMPQATLQRLHEVFPGANLVQTYGMSEVGVLRASARPDGSLWFKFRNDENFETKVVDGVLWVRSQTTMLGYFNAPDLIDEHGWLNTQDAVEVDGDYLRILGRTTDLINVGGQKVYPAEVENVILSMENVRDVAVYGEPNPMTGKIVAARVNLADTETVEAFKHRMRIFCRGKLESFKIPVRVAIATQDQFGPRYKKIRHA